MLAFCKSSLGCCRMIWKMRHADACRDVDRHAVDEVRLCDRCLDALTHGLRCFFAPNHTDKPVGLDQREERLWRHEAPRAIDDLGEHMHAECGAESVLDLKKVVQLHNRENQLSPVGCVAHRSEFFDQSGQVEQARVRMVFVQPFELA